MEYSDSEGEKHLDVEHSHSRYFNLTHDHAALKPLWHPCGLCHAHSEECAEHSADNHGTCTEDGDDGSESVEHRELDPALVEHESEEEEHDTVSCVTETHRKEQEVEWSNDGSRVELAIYRHTVHTGE